MKDQRIGLRLGMVGVLILAFPACSSMNVMSTTDGTGQAASTDRAKGGQGSGSGRSPLTGFSKGPVEESVGGSGPLMLSKADQGGPNARGTAARRSLGDIYFAYDQWQLSEEGMKNLADSAAFLKDHPRAKVMIEGHCDERGTGEYNLALGEKRAREARHYLADLGIRNSVAITSFGKERPICTEQDESCYWKNRRAHLVVEGDQ